jgi:hypothetical protein
MLPGSVTPVGAVTSESSVSGWWGPVSCVKYTWLLPLMLAGAEASDHHAYHRRVDSEYFHAERGRVLEFLVAWCDEAIGLADDLGL